MSVRLSLLVIMICPVMVCLATPTSINTAVFNVNNNPKSNFRGSYSTTKKVLAAGEDESGVPARRSIRRTYSKKRINRRWKRYLHVKPVRAKTVSKFEVPSNAKLVSPVAMNGNIEKWKSHLPWPVPSGTVSMRFGLYEVLKGINHNSNGITIETAPGIPVTAVFGGYVQGIFTVADRSVVMIRHGKYFTTYSNLSVVSVCKDDPISTGQVLGQVAENGQLDFIISDKTDKYYDPEKWLNK